MFYRYEHYMSISQIAVSANVTITLFACYNECMNLSCNVNIGEYLRSDIIISYKKDFITFIFQQTFHSS